MITEANPTAVLSLAFSAAAVERPMLVLQQDPPWRVVRSFVHPCGEQLVHLHNLSGGILGGDQLELRLQLGRSTRILATSTGATRVYKHRPGRRPARCVTRVTIAQDALLELLPDQLIPFRDAQFEQHTSIELAPGGAGIFWWETVSAGRTASDEDFDYAYLQIRVQITCEGKPIAIERFTLEPSNQDLRQSSVLGRFHCFSTFYICNTGVDRKKWLRLLEILEDELQSISSDQAIWGASHLVQHGIVMRGLGNEASDLQVSLYRFWNLAKSFLYGREAIIPRKIH